MAPCPAYNCGVDLASTDQLKHWDEVVQDPITNIEHALLIEVSAMPGTQRCPHCNQSFPTTAIKLLADHKKHVHQDYDDSRNAYLRDGDLGTMYGFVKMVRIYAGDGTKPWAQEKQQKMIFDRLVLKIQKSPVWPQLKRFRGYTEHENFGEDLTEFLSANRKPGMARHYPVPPGEFLNHAQYDPSNKSHKELQWNTYWDFFRREYDAGHI